MKARRYIVYVHDPLTFRGHETQPHEVMAYDARDAVYQVRLNYPGKPVVSVRPAVEAYPKAETPPEGK